MLHVEVLKRQSENLLKKTKERQDLSKEDKKKEISKIKKQSILAKKEASEDKYIPPEDARDEELMKLNTVSLILRDGVASFNCVGSIIASLITHLIRVTRGLENEDVNNAMDDDATYVGIHRSFKSKSLALHQRLNDIERGRDDYNYGKTLGKKYQKGENDKED